jgi:hypothetical protein
MPEDDAKLETLLRADLPPRDALFRLAVLERLERRRFRRQMAAMLAAIVGILLIAINAAPISVWLAEDMTRFVAVAAVVAMAVWTFPGRWQSVLSLPRMLARPFL